MFQLSRRAALVALAAVAVFVAPPGTEGSAASSADADAAASDPDVPERLGGSDRFETAATISAAFFDPGVERAYVATGFGFTDALTGGVAANSAPVNGAPLLLTTRESVTAATSAELDRLDPGEIVILGGTAAVGPSVETALAGFTDGDVRRVSGSQRFATAAAISADHFEPDQTGFAFVATGTDFADALAGTPWAGMTPGPMLLVTPDTVPDATRAELERLDVDEINVLGGTGAISESVQAELTSYADNVQRVAGANRFETAVRIAGIVNALLAGDPVEPVGYIATGLEFADALAGGAAVPAVGGPGPGPGPLLLVTRDTVPPSVSAHLGSRDGSPYRDLVVFGGTDAVSAETEQELRDHLDG